MLVCAMTAIACGVSAGDAAERPSKREVLFVKALFAEVQPKSIRRDREYCGYLGYDADGALVATRARRGTRDGCWPRWPRGFDPVASYHTHAGYDSEAWSEIPSGMDMEADEADGIDGYIATPGGRLWYVDSSEMIASQLCGVGCLPMDADFRPETEIMVRESYSYDELVDILHGPRDF